MKLPRRRILGMGAVSLGAALLTGCESLEQRWTRPTLPPNAFAPPKRTDAPAIRILNRVAYGPCPGDTARIAAMGFGVYVEEQLRPETIAETTLLTARLRPLGDVLNTDAGTLFDIDDHQLVTVLRQATLLRAVYSRRQLFERMAEFWGDHFNIYVFKAEGAQLKVTDDRDTIRAHALGNFRDLLGASARSAAMLGYLDNGSNQKGTPNENYARELMELHTLGVHGGYTQGDVQEVARALTGWTAERHWHRGRFTFDAARHDDGPKRILGLALPAHGGQSDGERVLDLLAAHPATAHHISRKLCRHFLGSEPSPLIASLAATFQRTGGDIPSILRVLLLSADILTGPPILKRPLDYAVSALRALDADTDGGPALQSHLEAMGQAPFAWPMPDGFPEQASAWTGALLPRWNFALALAGGGVADTSVDWPGLKRAGAPQAVCAPEQAALHLMSPGFQWR